jgi:beta-glucosidase
MTLEEKIAMVHGAGYPVPCNGAGYAGVVPGNARLGIPPLYLADSPVGVGNGSTGVTQWPDTAALASTFSTSLARSYGLAYGAEQGGKGNNVALAPTVNILRLPVWGARAGDVRRRPVPHRTGRHRGDPRYPKQSRDRHCQALRRQQPGDLA